MVDGREWYSPVSVTGRERSEGVVLSELALSVITIHGGSPSPVYLSTAALLTYRNHPVLNFDYVLHTGYEYNTLPANTQTSQYLQYDYQSPAGDVH